MKIIKVEPDPPQLYEFIKRKLANIEGTLLECFERRNGYNTTYGIKIKEHHKSIFHIKCIEVANVDCTTINLFHPNYYSDFVKWGEEYEEKYKKEITLRFWEGK